MKSFVVLKHLLLSLGKRMPQIHHWCYTCRQRLLFKVVDLWNNVTHWEIPPHLGVPSVTRDPWAVTGRFRAALLLTASYKGHHRTSYHDKTVEISYWILGHSKFICPYLECVWSHLQVSLLQITFIPYFWRCTMYSLAVVTMTEFPIINILIE